MAYPDCGWKLGHRDPSAEQVLHLRCITCTVMLFAMDNWGCCVSRGWRVVGARYCIVLYTKKQDSISGKRRLEVHQ